MAGRPRAPRHACVHRALDPPRDPRPRPGRPPGPTAHARRLDRAGRGRGVLLGLPPRTRRLRPLGGLTPARDDRRRDPPAQPGGAVLSRDRIDALRAQLKGSHAAQWRRLYEQADSYRLQHPPQEHPLARITYFGPAAANLALAHRLSGDPGYAAEAWRWISTAISFPHWGRANLPDHDLDAGWLLHGLSLAYHLLGDDLTDDQRKLLRDKLTLQGERLYAFAVETEGRWWSSSYWQNH